MRHLSASMQGVADPRGTSKKREARYHHLVGITISEEHIAQMDPRVYG